MECRPAVRLPWGTLGSTRGVRAASAASAARSGCSLRPGAWHCMAHRHRSLILIPPIDSSRQVSGTHFGSGCLPAGPGAGCRGCPPSTEYRTGPAWPGRSGTDGQSDSYTARPARHAVHAATRVQKVNEACWRGLAAGWLGNNLSPVQPISLPASPALRPAPPRLGQRPSDHPSRCIHSQPAAAGPWAGHRLAIGPARCTVTI